MEVNGLPIVKLGEILPASYKNGIYKNSDFYGDGTRILRITDFDNNGNLVNRDLRRLELTPKEVKNYQLQNQDIVVNRVNSLTHLGKSILWNEDRDEDIVYESNMMRIEADTTTILPEFLIRVLQSHNARSHFRKVAKRAVAQCSISQQDVKSLKFPLPTVLEQKKIAQILSTWDQAITATEHLLENSQKRKKGLMQQLLTGKKRLPGFEGEWCYQEIGQFLVESRIPSDSNDPSKRLTVRLNLKGIEQREVRGTEAKGSTAHYVRFAGQFIYGKQNIHKAAFGLIPESFDKFETSQDLPAFDFEEGIDSHWFLYFCSQEWFYTDLEKKMTGTGSKRLNPKAFLKVKLPTPSVDEQRAIAEVLDLASRDIDSIKNKLELLQNEKKALMQQLLTGKQRVNVESEAA